MKILMLFVALCLASCTLLDATARHGVGQQAVFKLSKKHAFVRNEIPDGQWRPFSFCQHWSVEHAQLPLDVHFACQLNPDDIERYQRILTYIHPLIMDRLQHSLLAAYLPLDYPPCFYIVPADTKVRRYHAVSRCLAVYFPIVGDPANKSEDNFIIAQLSFYYASWLHEAFHIKTIPSWYQAPKTPFANVWLNEYLAYLIGDFVGFTVLTTIPPEPSSRIELNEEDQLWRWINRQNCDWAIQIEQQGAKYNTDYSMAGIIFKESFIASLDSQPSMLPFYYLEEFNALAEPGADLANLLTRIPRCQPDKVGDVFALKQHLLDYDIASLAVGESEAETGLNAVMQLALQQKINWPDPFMPCRNNAFSPRVVKACAALWLDYLILQQQLLVATPEYQQYSSGWVLPLDAASLQRRWQVLLQDMQFLKQLSADHTSTVSDYMLAEDHRFRNSQQQVADTGAGLNVWPGDTDCELSGEQLVTTLAGQTVPLQRCRLQEGLGVLWRKDGQADQVIGLPTLVAQQARLVRDQEAMHYSVRVPYVFQDGFVVFQQMDHQVRLNICLDTGSPWSYITRRYRERYQLTPTYLAARLEPETELGELPRRVVLPILGAQRKVRVLPHAGFMQCDLIMGSDLLEQYSAIELGANTLKLWYAQEPKSSSLH